MKNLQKIFLATLSLGLPLLAGCGGSGSSSSASPAPQPRSVSATTPNGLTATLTENADIISQNGSVTYTITLTNPTNQTVTMQLSQGCSGVDVKSPDASLKVTDASGALVYPTGPFPLNPCIGSVPPATQTIAPGQTLKTQFLVTSKTQSQNGSAGLTQFQPFGAKGVYSADVSVSTSLSSGDTVLGPLTLTVQ